MIATGTLQPLRAVVYRWLAGVFAREPDPEALAAFRGPDGRAVLLTLAEATPLREGATGLLAKLDGAADLEALAFELAGAYARLFLGAGGASAVPPYESVHASAQRRLYQQATTDMQRLMAEHGLTVAGAREPADHIAVELEFLAALVDSGAVELERRLLEEHLQRWAPAFCAACIARDPSGYYAAAARVLRGMLEIDREA